MPSLAFSLIKYQDLMGSVQASLKTVGTLLRKIYSIVLVNFLEMGKS